MDRRAFLGSAGGAALASPSKRPNILFLFADDMRFDTVNNPEVRTPNLNRLAARGTHFTHACIMGGTIGAVCVPSRGMLLTGQSLFHVQDSIIQPRNPRPFALFPELLRQHGYATFGTGKWHNPPALFTRAFSHGADIFFGGMSDHLKVPVADYDPSGRYPKEARRNGGKFSSELFTDAAIRFLEDYRGPEPFLMYVAYTAPHDPRMAPDQYAAMYPPEKVRLPPSFLPQHPFDNGEMNVRDEALAPWPRTPEIVRQHIAAYYAMITHLDAQIGRLLGALEAAGRARDTMVIFAADNGLAVGRHGLFGKQNLYDHSVRVPLIIAGPGVARNKRTNGLHYILDLCPTVCEMAGVPVPETVEGRSVLRGGRDSIFLAYRHFQRGVRTERWKLILYHHGGRETAQLFEVEKDPWEMNNLAEAQPARVRQLRGLLREWMQKVDDPLDLDQPDWGYRPDKIKGGS